MAKDDDQAAVHAAVQEKVKGGMHQVAEEIRRYSREQCGRWRRVPALALEADGRQGYSDQYRMAYSHGFWGIGGMYVDLLSGELVCFRGFGESVPNPADDATVIALADNLAVLDAKALITRLNVESRKPTLERYDRKQQAEWRAKIRRSHHDLGDLYEERNRTSYPRFDVMF